MSFKGDSMFSTSLYFMGRYEKNRKYNDGDVVDMSGKILVWHNGTFIDLGTYSEENTKEQTALKCKNCGAPLIKYDGQTMCEYCGTTYQ